MKPPMSLEEFKQLEEEIRDTVFPKATSVSAHESRPKRWHELLTLEILVLFAPSVVPMLVALLADSRLRDFVHAPLSVSSTDRIELSQQVLVWWGIPAAVVCMALALLLGRWMQWHRVTQYAVPTAVVCSMAFLGGAYTAKESKRQEQLANLELKLHGRSWIAYESPNFDPNKDQVPRAQLIEEMKTLRAAGFDGIITFHSYGADNDIVELAHEAGFQHVIVGIDVPKYSAHKNETLAEYEERVEQTVKPRIEKEIHFCERRKQIGLRGNQDGVDAVAAYCVGHNANRVSLRKLSEWIENLRVGTGKPVTSTFLANEFVGERGEEIRRLGDFVMADVHPSFYAGTSPQKAYDELNASIVLLSQLPSEKPVLLHMLMYPGFPSDQQPSYPGMTLADQTAYFTALSQGLILPRRMHCAVFAYDQPWKPRHGFNRAEEFAGIFTHDRTAKPAAMIISQGLTSQQRP